MLAVTIGPIPRSISEPDAPAKIALNPPYKGYEAIRKHFKKGGSAGYRGAEINKLIRRMIKPGVDLNGKTEKLCIPCRGQINLIAVFAFLGITSCDEPWKLIVQFVQGDWNIGV